MFPDIIITPNRLTKTFELIDHIAFVGHTHIAGVITEDREYKSPSVLGNVFEVTEKKAIVNVGSVGQPRDGNPSASYVIYDGKNVFFVRVTYDVKSVQEKILGIPQLANELADRLAEGR